MYTNITDQVKLIFIKIRISVGNLLYFAFLVFQITSNAVRAEKEAFAGKYN